MSPQPQDLVVRQHERHLCSLLGRANLDGDSAQRVVLAATDSTGSTDVSVEIIDCSAGGLGLCAGTFFPKHSELAVTVRLGAERDETISLTVRLQRVTMIDRTPSYYLGGSFVGEGPEHERRVARLIEAAKLSPATPKEAPRA